MEVTVLWADEDDDMIPHVFHGNTDGALTDHSVRMMLLYEAMAAEMDEETFEWSAEHMTTHVLAIFEGHQTPPYLWDGVVIGPPVAN